MTSAFSVDRTFEPKPRGVELSCRVFRNLDTPRLYEESVRRGEVTIARSGALVVDTGAHTGRSPQDKFIVRDALTDAPVWWENSQAMAPEHFDTLYADMLAHAGGMDLFLQDLYGGAEPGCRSSIRVYTEYAWHSLFIRHLLIKPSKSEAPNYVPELTILDLPSFTASPSRHGCRSRTVIAMDFSRGLVLIGGTAYAGEIKKAVFTFLNFILPPKGVMPMHCAANYDDSGVALFFGLSGTGKTTLSADPTRRLIGDDEHGWGKEGVFNFEGGCYAKAIKLSRRAEPQIFAATERFGAILENVVLDPVTRVPDFDDDSRTENTRIAYPLDFVDNTSSSGRAGQPKNIVMLTCDAFGVLPAISRLNPSQAIYHFLSGYTAKVAGTESEVREPRATFSTCFGAPFMPRRPLEYANLLRDLIAEHQVRCWLLNTGWSGGKHGTGQRMPIHVSRTLLNRALAGSFSESNFRTDPYFGLSVPRSAPGIDSNFLEPAMSWASKRDFDATAVRLVDMFRDNFEPFAPFVDKNVMEAEPRGVAA